MSKNIPQLQYQLVFDFRMTAFDKWGRDSLGYSKTKQACEFFFSCADETKINLGSSSLVWKRGLP